MKWLLITTTENRNTGDELIRIGVQNLIKEVDSKPEFILLDKEKWFAEPVEYDKSILCGMPLFWNNEVSTSQTIGWWGELMTGWVSERKKDFLILGVGNTLGVSGIKNIIEYDNAIHQAVERAYAVTTRSFVSNHPGMIDSVCPSVFAVEKPKEAKYKLCNFMPDGAHDKHFNEKEAEIWRNKTKELSDYCRERDFYFIVHSSKEYPVEYPEALGWEDERIIRFDKAEDYLDIYAQASCYFGNRLHGAVVAASLGRPALAVGYDTRLKMAEKVGAITLLPSEVSIADVKELIISGKEFEPYFIRQEKKILLELLNEFIK